MIEEDFPIFEKASEEDKKLIAKWCEERGLTPDGIPKQCIKCNHLEGGHHCKLLIMGKYDICTPERKREAIEVADEIFRLGRKLRDYDKVFKILKTKYEARSLAIELMKW